jgi:hypothetical protein
MNKCSAIPLRHFLRQPIPEIEQAALRLEQAAAALLAGNHTDAASHIQNANDPSVREWTESLWGKGGKYAVSGPFEASPAFMTDVRARMPDSRCQAELHRRDGYFCRFCGIPVIRVQVRNFLRESCPTVQIWGRKNSEQHAALQCMWAQYDHLLPHSRGGTNELSNLVVTCAPCNYGRMQYTLSEARLSNPLDRPPRIGPWRGLEHLLGPKHAA